MTGPEGNSEFFFPRISMFPETKSNFNFRSNKNQLYDLRVFLCNGSSWFLRNTSNATHLCLIWGDKEEYYGFFSDMAHRKTEQQTTVPRRGGEQWWVYTETRGVEVYIHRSSPTLRGQLFQYLPNHMDKKNASSISSSETFAKRRAIFLSVRKTVNIQEYSELREPIKMRDNCYPLIW